MSDDTLDRIEGWCDADADLTFDGTTVTIGGDPSLVVDIEMGPDALSLTHSHEVSDHPASFADEAAALLGKRGSMVAGEVITGSATTTVHLRYPIYLEGLNRQSFTVAVRDIISAVDGIEELAAKGAPNSAAPPVEESRLAAPPSEPEPIPEPAAAAPWAATHQAPASGMSAWTEPDPTMAPATTLAAGVQLRMEEQRGAWAAVTANNGWTGWVDARILQVVGAAVTPVAPAAVAAVSTAPATSTTGISAASIDPIGVIAAAAMVVGVFLKWGLPNALDWPVSSTWPLYEWVGWTQPRIGMLLLAAAAAVLAGALLPRIPSAVRIIGGLAGVILAVGMAVAIGLNWGWDVIREIEFVGLWVTFGASVLSLKSGSRSA